MSGWRMLWPAMASIMAVRCSTRRDLDSGAFAARRAARCVSVAKMARRQNEIYSARIEIRQALTWLSSCLQSAARTRQKADKRRGAVSVWGAGGASLGSVSTARAARICVVLSAAAVMRRANVRQCRRGCWRLA